MARPSHVKNSVGGAGVKLARVNEEKPVQNNDQLLVIVRIAHLKANGNNRCYGDGQIDNGAGQAQVGDNVFIIHGAASRMMERGFGAGSLVAVKIKRQEGEFDPDGKYQWVATYFDMNHAENVAINISESIQKKQIDYIGRARVALQCYKALDATDRDEPKAKKAYTDLCAGLAQNDSEVVLSAAGQLNVFVQAINRRKELDAKSNAEAAALLAEFGDLV